VAGQIDRSVSRRADAKSGTTIEKKGVFEKAQRAAQDAILDRIGDGEELVSWVNGVTAPAEIMSWIPILNILYGLKKKWWLIALTNKNLYLLQHGRMSASKILAVRSFPLNSVKRMEMKRGVFFNGLVVQLPSGQWKFKDMLADEIRPFIKTFDEIKKSMRGQKKANA
jgi:hypothetical protein